MDDVSVMISPWWAVLVAVIATALWRLLGVWLYRHIEKDSMAMRLINMLAYSLLGAVMMLLMINPSGLLATAEMGHRIFGLLVGICLLIFVKKLPIALAGAIGTFALLSLYL